MAVLGLRFCARAFSSCGKRGHSSSRCTGLLLSRPLLLRSTGPRRAGSVIVAYGLSCSAARGIFPDQGSNPCPLHWQEDSQPLRHQGSPKVVFWSSSLLVELFCFVHIKNLVTYKKDNFILFFDLENFFFSCLMPLLLFISTFISLWLDKILFMIFILNC